MEIRSYRRVFDLERRIYRVDYLRLNPSGIPVRGVVYFLALLATAFIFERLPLLASLAGALPWYIRDLALPGAGGALLTVIRIEGRPFHLAAHALVRHRTPSGRLAGLRHGRPHAYPGPGRRWRPESVLLLHDGSDSRMRRLRYTGPGAVLVAVAHERELSANGVLDVLARRRRRLTLRQVPGACAPVPGQVIVLEPSARLRAR